MSWKYKANNRKPDTSTGVVLFIVFPAIIGLFFVPKVTLFIGFILIIFWILDKKLDKQNKPTLSDLEERLERVRVQNKNFDPNYKGSESYQALLKKYDGNIPGAGQGDQSKLNPKARNLGSRRGIKGGKYNERISKKGNKYRQYY